MILKYKIHYKFYCLVYFIMIYLLYTDTRLGRLCTNQSNYRLKNILSNRPSTIYNMSGRVVSDIQTRAEGESLYIRYNTDANVVNGLTNDSSYEFIGEVILKINVV